MKKGNSGFTLTELLTSLVLLAVIVAIITGALALLMGNHWYTDKGVIHKIRMTGFDAVDILTERSVLSKSSIMARDKNGAIKRYSLDSDILFNYELKALK